MRSTGNRSKKAMLALPNDEKRARSCFRGTYTNLILDVAPAHEAKMVVTSSLVREVAGSNPGKTREEKDCDCQLRLLRQIGDGGASQLASVSVAFPRVILGCLGKVRLSRGVSGGCTVLRPLATPSIGVWLGPSLCMSLPATFFANVLSALLSLERHLTLSSSTPQRLTQHTSAMPCNILWLYVP